LRPPNVRKPEIGLDHQFDGIVDAGHGQPSIDIGVFAKQVQPVAKYLARPLAQGTCSTVFVMLATARS
jgi:hypothetical protein